MESYQFDNVEEARKCLGFPKGESLSRKEAKRLYVLELRANNPDRVLGQDPKRTKEATERTQRLIRAWEYYLPSIPECPIDFSYSRSKRVKSDYVDSYQFDNVEEARKCLGFPKGESFSKEEAKRLYVLKLRANNPDRVLGQDPKRKKEATERTQRLIRAWEYFLPSIPDCPIDFSSSSSESESEEDTTTKQGYGNIFQAFQIAQSTSRLLALRASLRETPPPNKDDNEAGNDECVEHS